MDLLKSLLEQLLSERDVFSWNCHQSNKIVLTIKFELSPDERRHLENLGLSKVEFDSDSVTTYKKKSRYQIERDARRSFSLIKKHTENSQSKQSNQSGMLPLKKNSSSSDQFQKRDASSVVPFGSCSDQPEKSNASASSTSSPEVLPRGGNSSVVTEHAYSTPLPRPKPDAVPKRPDGPKLNSSPKTSEAAAKSPSLIEDACAKILDAIETYLPIDADYKRLMQDNYEKEKASGECFYCNEMIPSSPLENSDHHLFCSDLCRQLYDADHPSRSGSMNSSLSDVRPPD